MIYDNYTWTLPVQPHFMSSNGVSLRPFQEIMVQPSSQAARHTEEVLNRRFELDKTRHQETTNLHNCYSHPTMLPLCCVPYPDKVLPLPVLPPRLTTYPNCSFTALCACPDCVQSKDRMQMCQSRPGCKCTKCMSFYNKDVTWNEVWASWSVSKPFWKPPPAEQ
jgi:hypothetical protein